VIVLWFLLAGLFFVGLALSESVVARLPLTTATLYLAAGALIGPLGLGLVTLDPVDGAGLLERITEVAVIVSLFSAGLKLRLPLRDPHWRVPVRLAFASMTITVALVAVAGVVGLGLPIGAAVLLGAVLAPTDPVLASAVQVATPTDRDRLRFTLTGEAGLNDGTAFPFVMLGLGLLGLHGIGVGGWRWWAVDVVWAIGAGLAIGALFGAAAARLVLHLRRRYGQAVGTDDFLALGLIALAYGAALAAHAYGFLAVFAAGLALGRVDDGERRVAAEEDAPAGAEAAGATPQPDIAPPDAAAAGAALPSVPEHPTAAALALADPTELATDARLAPAFLAQAVLGFSQQLERIGEVAVVVVMGVVLATSGLSPHALWLAPLLFLVIRPLSVLLATSGQGLTGAQRTLTGWFGVRGIGSVYYLAYAIAHGVVGDQAYLLADVTLTIVAASVVVHGVSVTPLMRRYDRVERGEPTA